MFKLFKLLKSLKAKGFATAEEKAEVKVLFKELASDEQEEVKADVEEAEKLPETDPNSPKDDDEDKEIEEGIKALVGMHVKTATKAEVAKASETIMEKVKEFLESQKDLFAKKAGVYNTDVKEKRAGLNSYLKSYLSGVLSGDVNSLMKINKMTSTKELTTDSTGSPYGGYATTGELSAEIRALITEYGVARREFMTVQLTKHFYSANDLVTDVTVGWVSEAGSITSTQTVFGQEALNLKKLGAIVTMTRELIEDQEIDLFAFIAERIAQAFAEKEDDAFFNGAGTGDTGNGEFTGVLNVVGANEVETTGTTFASMTADDLLDMQDKSPQSVAKNGKYYGHRSIRNLIRKLKDDNNQYIYQNPSETGPATVWGKTFVEVEVMPSTADTAEDTPFLAFADLKKAMIFGYKGTLSADKFNAGIVRNVAGNADINLITTDREAVRFIERVGAVAIIPSAITILKTKAGS